MNNITDNETARRYFVFLISLFLCGLGIAFCKHSELGVTPISSVVNVVSLRYEFLSFGMWLCVWNIILVCFQIVILGKGFNKIQFLQIPMTFLFGVFTDLGGIICNRFPVESYYYKLIALILGIVILSLGISMAVCANVLLNAGEGAVLAIATKTGFKFGNVKIVFDIILVAATAVLSLALFDMKIVGIGEGTVISAVFTGIFVKLFTNTIKEDLEKWMSV